MNFDKVEHKKKTEKQYRILELSCNTDIAQFIPQVLDIITGTWRNLAKTHTKDNAFRHINDDKSDTLEPSIVVHNL